MDEYRSSSISLWLSTPDEGTMHVGGSGYECVELAKAGYKVLGIDISPTALHRAQTLADAEGLASSIDLQASDFFLLKGTFELIFDYTCETSLPGCP
jgi:D-arabinose 1-dehydrogenase-like Zn-dependent alcohol dehydrogenase